MQRSIYQNKVLDTIQTSGQDIVVKDGYLYINGTLMWAFKDVENAGISKAVAVASVTPAVLTYTVPAVPLNSTVYTIQVTVNNPTAQGDQQNPLVFNIPVTTVATGTLANTDLVTQFTNAINSVYQAYNTYFVASGSTTLILTATTAYPVMIGGVTAPITVVQTTAGVPTSGLVANLIAQGVQVNTTPPQLGKGTPLNTIWLSGTSGTLAGTSYTTYICANAMNVGEVNTGRFNQENTQVLYISEQATNYAVFIADLDNVLKGFIKAGGTINVHIVETVAGASAQ